MSRSCVVDASSTLAWLYGEARDSQALDLVMRDLSPVVPQLWRLEVTNSLLKRQRAKTHTPARIREFLAMLDAFPVDVLPEPEAADLSHLFDVAKPHQLSSYDATYLDAALRHRLPLLTHDRNLRLAAAAEGVELV